MRKMTTRKSATVNLANLDFDETELSNPVILFHYEKLAPPKTRISKFKWRHKDNSKNEINVSTCFENTQSTCEAQKGDALCKDVQDTESSCTTSAESSDNIVFLEPDQVNNGRQLEGPTRKISKPYKISFHHKRSRTVRYFLNPPTKESFQAKYPSRNKKIYRYSTFGALNNEKTDKTYKIRYRNEPCKMRPCQIEFTKQRLRAKYPGRNKTVFSTFGALKYDKLRVEDLPKIRVFRYGNNCYTPDNRWLFLLNMFAPVYKMRHGVNLSIPVLFIERFQRLEVSKKLGVSRDYISLKRLPKYDNLKEEPRKFKLYLRPKRGQVKKLEPRGIRLTKAEINKRRRGQIPSMNFDIHPDPDMEPEYNERQWREPVTIGDYIEKFIGDKLRESMINKDFSFSNTAKTNTNMKSRSQSRHSGSDKTGNKPASKNVGDTGTREKTKTRGQQAKPKSKSKTQANTTSGQNISSNQHRKKKEKGQKNFSNLHTRDQKIREPKVKRATERSESRGDKHVSENVFDKVTKANTNTNGQQTGQKSNKRTQANTTSAQNMSSNKQMKNKGKGQSDIGTTGHGIPIGIHVSSTAQSSANFSKDGFRNSQVATSVSRSPSFKFLNEPSQHHTNSFRQIPKQFSLELTPKSDDHSLESAEKGAGKIETSFGLQKGKFVSLNSTSIPRQSGAKSKQKKKTETKSSARQELKTVEDAEAIPSANDQRRPFLTHSMGSSWAVLTSPIELVDGSYVRTSKKIEFTAVHSGTILKGKTKKRNKKGTGINPTEVNSSKSVSCQNGNIQLTAKAKTTTVSHTENDNCPSAKPNTATLSQHVSSSSLSERQNTTPSNYVDYSSLGARPKTTTLPQPVDSSSLSEKQNTTTPSHPGARPKTTTLSEPLDNSRLGTRPKTSLPHPVYNSSVCAKPNTIPSSNSLNNRNVGASPKATATSNT